MTLVLVPLWIAAAASFTLSVGGGDLRCTESRQCFKLIIHNQSGHTILQSPSSSLSNPEGTRANSSLSCVAQTSNDLQLLEWAHRAKRGRRRCHRSVPGVLFENHELQANSDS